MNPQVERFRNEIAQFLNDWLSIDVRVVGWLSSEGKWLFSAVRAVLDPTEPGGSTTSDLPSIPKLIVAHERWSIKKLDELLESLSNGEVGVKGETIHIKQFDGHNWQMPSLSFQFWDRNYCRPRFGIDFSSFILSAYASTGPTQDELRLIDGRLRTAEKPWDGLTDVRQNFIGLSRDYAAQNAGFLEVIAPLGVRLYGSDMDGKEVVASVDTHLAQPEKKVGLTVIAQIPDGSKERLRRTLTGHKQRLSTVIKLPEEPSRVNLIATHKEIDVDRAELFKSKSPRLAILHSVGAGIPELSHFLEEARGRNLEAGFALLLHLLGFSPVHYGDTPFEAPDIVAFPDSGNWLLVVECTAREPDLANKLTKLATRAKEMSQATGGLQAHPIIVTALERQLVSKTDSEKAAKEGIAIVTKDETQRLLQMVREEAKPHEVRDYLIRFKPYLISS